MPKVSVLVSTFRPGGLDITLAGMRDQTFKDFEVIIVDKRYNKRHKEVLELAKNYGVNLIHVPEHRLNGKWNTFCSAWNTAMALAHGDLLIYLCDWTYMQPGTIEGHIQAHSIGNRYVLAPYIYTSMPEFSTPYLGNLEEQASRGLRCTENDDILNGGIIDEMFPFKDGPFNGQMLFSVVPSQPPDQDPRLSWYPSPMSLDPASSEGWVHIKHESISRNMAWELNGLDERMERGKGPMDINLELRMIGANMDLYWDTSIAPAICPNPRWYCRSMPWGDMTERLDNRWSFADGHTYNKTVKKEIEISRTVEEKKYRLKAKNPYSMPELSTRLSSWRNESNHPVSPIDVDDFTYWGKEIWPETDAICDINGNLLQVSVQQISDADLVGRWMGSHDEKIWPPYSDNHICDECNENVFVELGGADNPASYHPNLDIRMMPGVDKIFDFESQKIPFHDNHAERIKIQHVLNHLRANTAKNILHECLRVLKPGGSLYIMVTDIEFVCKRILEDGLRDCWGTCVWGTLGDTYEADFHYYGYTQDSLRELLLKIGFSNIQYDGNPNGWEFRMSAKK